MHSTNSRSVNQGFTLIEVLLSISLMTVALTGVNLLITNGLRSSVDGHDRTEGLLLAHSITESLLLGNRVANQGVDYRCNPPYEGWIYQWSAEPADLSGLVTVVVVARRDDSDRDSRVKVRWAQLAYADQLQQDSADIRGRQ